MTALVIVAKKRTLHMLFIPLFVRVASYTNQNRANEINNSIKQKLFFTLSGCTHVNTKDF